MVQRSGELFLNEQLINLKPHTINSYQSLIKLLKYYNDCFLIKKQLKINALKINCIYSMLHTNTDYIRLKVVIDFSDIFERK